LVKEQKDFKRKILANPVVVESKRKKEEPPPKKGSGKAGPSSKQARHSSVGGGSGSGPSAYKFGVLTKIVRHLKLKFQNGEDSPLTLEDILDETNQLDANNKVRAWLQNEALPHNPKIEVTSNGTTFMFKPPLKCRDKRSLLRLLRTYDMKGMGGIFRDDVIESVPHAEKILQNLDKDIITITRLDKKKVLFYDDHQNKFELDDEFQKLWRSVTVDGLDDHKIDEYLEKAGIKSMEGQGVKKATRKLKKRPKRKIVSKIKDNDHLVGVLQNYEV